MSKGLTGTNNKMAVHFSSATDDWATPQDFFDEMNKKYGPFDLDVCATEENAKCVLFLDKEQDGLTHSWFHVADGTENKFDWWHPTCWMNPPYGRGIGAWVKKAYEESQKGCKVVCLLPARTDTKWFHDYCTKGRIEFIRGRLKFGGSKNSAPFPSMVVVFEKA